MFSLALTMKYVALHQVVHAPCQFHYCFFFNTRSFCFPSSSIWHFQISFQMYLRASTFIHDMPKPCTQIAYLMRLSKNIKVYKIRSTSKVEGVNNMCSFTIDNADSIVFAKHHTIQNMRRTCQPCQRLHHT